MKVVHVALLTLCIAQPLPAEVSLQKEEPAPTISTAKTKKITNAITKKDIGYKYLFVNRYPEKFTITVNGKELKSGESTTISDTDTFETGYSYEWWAPWQIYKGSGTKKYRIPENVNEVQITFTNWHNPARIAVAKAQLIDENTVFADQKKQSSKGKKPHGK